MKKLWLLLLGLLSYSTVFAEQTIINNYGTAAQPAPQTPPPSANNCQTSQDNSNSPSEGTYSYHNNTTSGTIVTTGEKKPYIVDNCNNSPAIQPYVYAQPPGPPAPGR